MDRDWFCCGETRLKKLDGVKKKNTIKKKNNYKNNNSGIIGRV